MKHGLLLLFLLFTGWNLAGQNQSGTMGGTVSFITSQNVYVNFTSTEGIKAGDTLFLPQGDKLVPVLKVKDLSSKSCVCIPLTAIELKVSDRIIFKPSPKPIAGKAQPAPPAVIKPGVTETPTVQVPNQDTAAAKPVEYKKKQQIHGSLIGASYSNWSHNSSTDSQREKFTLALSAKNLGNSNLSAECYVSYYLNDRQVNEVSNSVFNSLKIYNFDFSYDFGKRATLLLGRKINPKLSNMGSNDGLQFELKFKPISIGLIAGYRPDFNYYGFNSNLFQYGAYLYNELAGKKGFMQTTLAFINQTNSWKTDRRFIYLQHVNSLVKNLTFFGSVEWDLYGKSFNGIDSTFSSNSAVRLTNLYVSLGYRIRRVASLSLSYSARQNVIYYETYKSYLDRLLDNQTLQGYSFQLNLYPVKKLSFGGTVSYRFQPSDPKPSENVYAYLSYSQIPGINTTATVSAIIMQTGYIKGRIYSAGLSKDLAAGKLYLGLTYRYVDYHYFNTEILPTYQHMGEASLTWRIVRKLALSIYYEGTFEKLDSYNQVYAQLNWGF